MKISRLCVPVLLGLSVLFATPACKKSESSRPATASTVGKEKHTKTKTHKREKKAEKAAKGGKTPHATPAPANP